MQRLILAVCLCAVSTVVVAHGSPVQTTQWCTSGHRVNVFEFEFTEDQIVSAKQCLLSGACRDPYTRVVTPVPNANRAEKGEPNCPPTAQECGDFPDDWRAARFLAEHACDAFETAPSPNSTLIDEGEVQAVVTNQQSTFYANDHHTAYQAVQRLNGYCSRCMISPQN